MRDTLPAWLRKKGLRRAQRILLAAVLVGTNTAIPLSLAADTAAPTAIAGTAGEDARASVDDLYIIATAALDAGQSTKAREILEGIVARRPDFAGAWLDLALATYRDGHYEAAVEHLDYLRTHFTLPPAISWQVDEWYARWQRPTGKVVGQDKWQGELTFGIGHDTNVNSGLANNSLSITLPGGNVEFPVDKASRPLADQFAQISLNVWGPPRPLFRGELTPIVSMRVKRLAGQTDFDTLDLQAGGVFIAPSNDDSSWRLGGFLQQGSLGGKPINTIARAEVQRLRPWLNCQLSTGGELELRHAMDESEMGGRVLSLSSGIICPMPADARLAGALQIGRTSPKAGWPGGDKNGLEMALQYSRPLSGERRLDLAWRTSWLNDTEGYSSLLKNGAARRLLRHNFSATVRQPLTDGWSALFSIEMLRQQSNLELFRYDTQLYMMSLVRRF